MADQMFPPPHSRQCNCDERAFRATEHVSRRVTRDRGPFFCAAEFHTPQPPDFAGAVNAWDCAVARSESLRYTP
eukprot:6573660-Prymnesium_polylepis.1